MSNLQNSSVGKTFQNLLHQKKLTKADIKANEVWERKKMDEYYDDHYYHSIKTSLQYEHPVICALVGNAGDSNFVKFAGKTKKIPYA